MQRVTLIGLVRMRHGTAGPYLDIDFKVAVWNQSKTDGPITRAAQWSQALPKVSRWRQRSGSI